MQIFNTWQVHRDEASSSVLVSAPQVFAAHATPLTAAAFSANGAWLVTCDGAGVVLLWSNLAAPGPEAWNNPSLPLRIKVPGDGRKAETPPNAERQGSGYGHGHGQDSWDGQGISKEDSYRDGNPPGYVSEASDEAEHARPSVTEVAGASEPSGELFGLPRSSNSDGGNNGGGHGGGEGINQQRRPRRPHGDDEEGDGSDAEYTLLEGDEGDRHYDVSKVQAGASAFPRQGVDRGSGMDVGIYGRMGEKATQLPAAATMPTSGKLAEVMMPTPAHPGELEDSRRGGFVAMLDQTPPPKMSESPRCRGPSAERMGTVRDME